MTTGSFIAMIRREINRMGFGALGAYATDLALVFQFATATQSFDDVHVRLSWVDKHGISREARSCPVCVDGSLCELPGAAGVPGELANVDLHLVVHTLCEEIRRQMELEESK